MTLLDFLFAVKTPTIARKLVTIRTSYFPPTPTVAQSGLS